MPITSGLLVFAVGAVWPTLALPTAASKTLYVAVYLAAPSLVAWRAIWDERERWPWLLIAAGMFGSAFGYAYYYAVLSGDPSPPVPSPSDGLWVTNYVLSFAGLLLLLRSTLLDAPRALLWMNALGALLAGAAVVAATIIDPVVQATGGAPAAVATALVYPVSDVIILALLFIVFAVRRWRPGRFWVFLGCTWIFTAGADVLYAHKAATGSYVGNELLDVTWPLAMLAIAFAAWRWRKPMRKVRLPAAATVVTPALLGTIAGGLLVYGNFAPLHTIAVVLASSTIVAAVIALAAVEHGVRRLRSQSRSDPLMGVLNHREFHDAVARHIAVGSPFAIAMLDLDGFKHVNDFYGHAEGDRLLHAVARTLERACRDEDVLCRVGGDEFAVVLPGAGTAEADAAAARLAAAVKTVEPEIGASVGLAQWPHDGPGKDALLLRADVSLYSAKHSDDDVTSALGGRANLQGHPPPVAQRTDQAAAGAPGLGNRLAGIDRYRRSTVMAACAALAALVVAANSVPEHESALLILLVVPIAVLALRFAVWGGVLGGLIGALLLGLPPLLGHPGPGAVGYVARSVTYLTIGLLVGHLSGQTRRARALLERRVARGAAEVRQARTASEAERDFLAAVLESLDEGVVACDAQGVLSFFNDATRRLHGLPERTIPATEWAAHYDIFRADGTTPMPTEEIPLMRAFAGEAIREVAMVVAPSGKEPRTLMATGRPIVGPDGQRNGAVVAMRDVTEQLYLQRQIQLAIAEAMTRLGRAVGYRDGDTGEHVARMSHGCRLLAKRAGLDPERCAMIEIASGLHDIGKLTVPDAVLLKPGKLDAEEWKLMEAHTVVGHELLAGSENDVLDLAATIALSHHERVDGTGYPHGSRGDAIPIEARIAAIADVFDALTSDRPYRPAFSTLEALDIMTRDRGTHFDAALLDLFVEACPAWWTSPTMIPAGALAPLATSDDQDAGLQPQERTTSAGPDERVRDCLTEATSDLSDYLADARDDAIAEGERMHTADTGATANGGAVGRQPSRERRWAADDRVRAAAKRAAKTTPEPTNDPA